MRRFGLKNGIYFAHFGLESGVVFEGTTVVCELIFVDSVQMDKKERAICEFDVFLLEF